MSRRTVATLLLAVGGLVIAACGPRYVRETFYEQRDYKLVLRGRSGTNPGFDHPASISAVRLTHILASLDVRFEEHEKKNARTPAIPVEFLYPLGDLVSKAFAKADATQELVVMAERRERTLKLFTEKRLTSLVLWLKGDQLYVHLSRLDWPMPKNPSERIREPVPGKAFQKFKVLPGTAIVPTAQQTVAVAWRDDGFRRADAIRLSPGGRIKRRTVLMEEPEALAPSRSRGDAEGVDLSTLSPDALRELADLEEARRAGEVGEQEYLSRRREILGPGRR